MEMRVLQGQLAVYEVQRARLDVDDLEALQIFVDRDVAQLEHERPDIAAARLLS